jgi:hypothetical protein
MARCLRTGTAVSVALYLIQWSGTAEGYTMRYSTLQLELTYRSGLATDRDNDVFVVSLPSLQLQQPLRHDMANTGYYRMALHVLNVKADIKAEQAPADTHHKL